jgi:hypothetical protein
MAHEVFYTEDFESDDDSVQNVYLNPVSQISFFPYQNEEIAKDYSPAFHDEKSVQCEESTPASLISLSQMPSISTSSLDKVIIPSKKTFELVHTPKVSINFIGKHFKCRRCGFFFKNDQELTDHLTKYH